MYLFPKLVFLLTIIGASYCHGNHQQKYLVCRPLDSLFEQQPSSYLNQSTLRGPPGRPGKRGPSGYKGDEGQPGPVGPQGLMNWTRIDNRIREIINEQRICTGVVYRDHCYWLPWIVATFSGHGGKSAAADVCGSHGATLVDIESEEMYDVLYNYIQKAWLMYVDRTYDYVELWLASSYTNGNVVSSTDGSIYTRWHSGYPNNNPVIAWIVGKSTRTAPTGMFTTIESYSYAVPFCRL